MLGKTHRAFAFATSAAVLVAVHSGIQTEEIALGHSLLLQTALHTGAILFSTAPDIDQGFGLGQHRGGAFYVKGFRGPFIPLYHVGDKTFSFMPILWWMIGCGLWIAAIWQIFNRCVITW